MRRFVNGILIVCAVVITVAVLFALITILQNLWSQTVAVATPMEAEDASNTFKTSALSFMFMALPFLGLVWGITVAVIRRHSSESRV